MQILHPQKADLLEQASTAWTMDEALPMIDTRGAFDQVVDMESAFEQGFYSGGMASGSGTIVGPESALRVAAVYACRRVIAEDIAKLPIDLFERGQVAGRRKTTRVIDHPVARLIDVAPNHYMTPFQFVEYMVATATIHEAAYAYIHRDTAGNPVELLPLMPGSVSVTQNQHWELTYHIGVDVDQVWQPDGRDLLKLHGHLHTPIRGFSLSAVAREAVGLASAIEAASARFHKNDLRPSGLLTTKGKLTDQQLGKLRNEWQSKYGPGGSGGIAVLDSDFDFKAMTATAVDSETLDNRKFQIEEICRFMRVLPTLIGHNNGSQSYGSVEQQMIAHVNHTLHPWVVRLEQALRRDLLHPTADAGLYIRVNMDALMRGTLTERVNAYANMVKVGWTPNEIREREDMDPLPDAAMDKVQLLANNTGLKPDAAPVPAEPKAPAKVLPPPHPA